MKKETIKNKKVTIDDLAIMVANGFERVGKDIAEVNEKLGKVEENLNATRMDVLGIGDRFVSKHEFSQHLIRFSHLEQKMKTKR